MVVQDDLLDKEAYVSKGLDLLLLVVRVGGPDDVGAEDNGDVAGGHHVLVGALRQLDKVREEDLSGLEVDGGQLLDDGAELRHRVRGAEGRHDAVELGGVGAQQRLWPPPAGKP